jgi:hypothetical protein
MAGNALTALTFEAWIEHAFSHEVRKYQNAWYFDAGCDTWNGPAWLSVEYLTRLFEDPAPALAYFSDAQIAQGLHYLIDSGAGGVALALGDAAVPLADRERCVRAIYALFSELFAPKCTPHLSHLDGPNASRSDEAGDLNGVCYMWWDVFATGTLDLTAATLQTMERILSLDSIACRESALHGLGHWRAYDERAVEAIIDAFLKRHPALRPELATYAKAARSGCVL